MFWAATLSKGSTLDLSKQKSQGELLHLSQANLQANSAEGLHTVEVTFEGKTYPLAHLDNKKQNSVSLDLYFNTSSGVKFSLKGSSDVTLLGYFEPSEEPVEAQQFAAESSEESEEEVPVQKPPKEEAKKPQKEESESEEESEEESESEESEEEPRKLPEKRPSPPKQPEPKKQQKANKKKNNKKKNKKK